MHRRLVHHEEQKRIMTPNKPWKKTILFPLYQRGTEGDFRIYATCLLLTLFSFPPVAQAGELGRLFFTPQQRQQLEFHETSGNSSSDSGQRNYIIVNGVVQKQGGNRTVWINGAAQETERGNDRTPATVPVAVPGKSRPVQLKVGQKLLLDSPAPEQNPAAEANK
jgi:hypothetical protein